MPYARRTCIVCQSEFVPPHRATMLSTGDNHLTHCAACRRVVKAAVNYEDPAPDSPILHASAAPMTQIVFDLETWGLDRGWGVTLVGSFLIYEGNRVIRRTLKLRDYPTWKKGIRSDDRLLVEDVFEILKRGHIAYAHNGEFFDIRWLRTVALKYGLQMPKIRLVDPAQISRQRYLLGRNSLEAVADYLGLSQTKLHISPDVWRHALLDDDDAAWKLLVDRCESDVDLLNGVAGAVTRDAGMIDYSGSWRG